MIGSLFRPAKEDTGPFFCSLYAPGVRAAETVLKEGVLYAYAEGPTPEDAVYEARSKLWGTL